MDFDRPYNKTLHFLSFRPRSEKEIKDYLLKKTKEEKVINKIINKLKEQNLINDEEFTGWWIDQRMALKPKGKIILKNELLQKGIDPEIIENKLSAINNQQLMVFARELVSKKLKLYKNLSYLQLKKKLSSFLARRGFDWQTIDLVIDEFLQK